MADDFQARLGPQGCDFGFGFHDDFQHRQIELEVHRVDVEFRAGFRQWTHVLFLHAVVGFGFILFTAKLVCSAAKPPTAFSTIQGTFPADVGGNSTTCSTKKFDFMNLLVYINNQHRELTAQKRQ
jgi:hypothetical protein